MTKAWPSRFPDPRSAGDDGLLVYGGDLSVETLLDSYSHGIFPWPQEGYPLLWFSPLRRGVIDFAEVHWPKRLLREIRTQPKKITFNQDFAQVIRACSQVIRTGDGSGGGGGGGGPSTWILPEMEASYLDLHHAGHAHSVECWNSAGELVGGLYGVYIAGVFSGESMFHKESNAGKFCLYALVERLLQCGLEWMDIQMVTGVLEAFGGKYIDRGEFQDRLLKARERPAILNF